MVVAFIVVVVFMAAGGMAAEDIDNSASTVGILRDWRWNL